MVQETQGKKDEKQLKEQPKKARFNEVNKSEKEFKIDTSKDPKIG